MIITVKNMRTLTGMTQQEFADYFNIPKRTIQNWESKSDTSRSCPAYVLELMLYKLKKENIIKY